MLFRNKWIRRTLACTTTVTLLAGMLPIVPARSARADDNPDPAPAINGQGLGTGGPPSMSAPSTQATASLASVDLSTGAATASFQFQLPAARGQAQARLGLTYSSNAGVGFAGLGWTLDVPSIERRGASGMPLFDSDVLGHNPLSDTYEFEGSPLIALCTLDAGGCSNMIGDEAPPQGLQGWTYFRTQVDNGMRFFLDPTGLTWQVQTKQGVTLVFGGKRNTSVGLGGDDPVERQHDPLAYTAGVSRIPVADEVFRWNLASQLDPMGNTIYYAWSHISPVVDGPAAREYLTDIYDTSPGTAQTGFAGAPSEVSNYAHHARLTWGHASSSAFAEYIAQESPSWHTLPNLLLQRVDVTSSPFLGGARELVRRYWLNYQFNANQTRSSLTSIVLEGTCGHWTENAQGELPTTTGCPTLPGLVMTYTGWQPKLLQGSVPPDLTGPFLIADANGDSLPDLASVSSASPSSGSVAFELTTGEELLIGTGTLAHYSTPTVTMPQGSPDLQATAASLFSVAPPEGSQGQEQRFVLGNWWNDGQLNWLWLDTSDNPQLNTNAYEVYSLQPQGPSAINSFGFVGFRKALPLANTFPSGAPDLQTGRAIDIDGDGLIDMMLVPQEVTGTNPQSLENNYFSALDINGQVQPFARPTVNTCPAQQLLQNEFTNGSNLKPVIADMDGDGLVDFVVLENTTPGPSQKFGLVTAHVFKNRGDGRFGLPSAGSDPCSFGAGLWYDVPFLTNINNGSGLDAVTFQSDGTTLHDVDGDGLADFVVLDVNGLHVIPQTVSSQGAIEGPGTAEIDVSMSALGCTYPPGYGYNQQNVAVDFADMNASGVDDAIVFACGGQIPWLDFQNGQRPGLLSTISNGLGLTATLSYDSLAHLIATSQNGTVAAPTVPVPVEVVTSVQSTNGLTGPYARSTTTSYTYGSPVYDARDRAFLGFQTVTSSVPPDGPSSPGLDTVTQFATGTCPGVGPGAPCPVGLDYGYRIMRGLPVAVERFANAGNESTPASGQILSETINDYVYQPLYMGFDKRKVRQVYVSRTTDIAWDKGQTASSTSRLVLTDATGADNHLFDLSATVLVPNGSDAFPHFTYKTFVQDDHGNQSARTDFGSPNIGDAPISVATTWRRPPNDVTGWAYRPASTKTAYADSNGNLIAPLRELDYAYNDESELPTSVSSPLSGTLPLSRGDFIPGDPALKTAPAPTAASHDSASVTLVTIARGAFGNVATVTQANGQCIQTKYDAIFAQLPIETDQYVEGSCGSANPLVTTRTFDRGLERVTSEVSPSLAMTTSMFDGFGRLLDQYDPDPTMSSTSDGDATVKVDYSSYDPPFSAPAPAVPPPLSQPVRILHISKNLGLTGAPAYADLWQYSDGADQPLVTVRSTPTGSGGAQVVEGAHVYSTSTGRVVQSWQPFFVSLSSGALYNVQGPVPTTPSKSFAYDALGRLLMSTDELGRTSTVTYMSSSFQTLVQDAIQTAAASAGGVSTLGTLLKFNGHGQVTSSVQQLTSDTITTQFTYLATGEVTQVQKSHPGGDPPYVRRMYYDTLGRLVGNAEPNTANPTKGSPFLIGWTYAYNNSGQLVGTSDARGCGKNIFYDPAGRAIGEDYSPCDTLQPPYSPVWDVQYVYGVPEVATANPAWYRGKVTAVYDRGQHARFTFDGRGRITEMDRQVSAFVGTKGYAYTNHYFTRQFAYDEADRVITATTGADVPELTQAGSSVSTAYAPLDVAGGVVSAQSSYGNGNLLNQRIFDASGRTTSESFGDYLGLTRQMSYYPDGALQEMSLTESRGLTLQDLAFKYDAVNNPTTIADSATYPWPSGTLAPTRQLGYDDSYRLTSATTTYGTAGTTDVFTPTPVAPGWPPYQTEVASGDDSFPYLLPLANRVASQTFTYDWLDNVRLSDDDQHAAPDRSFGTATYATAASSMLSAQPNHLTGAAQAGPNGASIQVGYDYAGNTNEIIVSRPPIGASAGVCAGACQSNYAYEWDEVGRLLYAERLDSDVPQAGVAGGVHGHVLAAYTYDWTGARVLKLQVDDDPNTTQETETYHLTVFPTLRVDADGFDSSGDYVRSASTESVYLEDGAGTTYGRAAYEGPSSTGTKPLPGGVHVYLELGDQLGSTAFVVDHDSGEIVERPGYLAYGADETDYTSGFREPYRYTGHDSDAEVGLAYFGARYFIPMLARWASPDPLTIHDLASQLNPYAYAKNSPFANVDPTGLQAEDGQGDPIQIDTSGISINLNFFGGGSSNGGGGGGYSIFVPPPPPPNTGFGSRAFSLGPNYWVGPYNNTSWNPTSSSSVGAMLLGSPGTLTLEQTDPALAAFLRVGGMLIVGGLPVIGTALAIRTALDGEASTTVRVIAVIGVAASLIPVVSIVVRGAGAWTADVANVVSEGAAAEGLAARGPAATLDLAMKIQGSTPLSAQSVALLETVEGPTLVGAGAGDLTAEQVALARQFGLTPTTLPGFHAEQTVINAAGELGLTPTNGVVTNNVCAGRCGPLISEIGGWFNGKNFGF
jgi:RHS repeat-associated protein